MLGSFGAHDQMADWLKFEYGVKSTSAVESRRDELRIGEMPQAVSFEVRFSAEVRFLEYAVARSNPEISAAAAQEELRLAIERLSVLLKAKQPLVRLPLASDMTSFWLFCM